MHEAVGDAVTHWELATLEVGTRYEQMAAAFWAEVLDRARSLAPS